jgi:hypothetical protein
MLVEALKNGREVLRVNAAAIIRNRHTYEMLIQVEHFAARAINSSPVPVSGVSSYDRPGSFTVSPPPVVWSHWGSSKCAPGPSIDSLSQGLRSGQTPSERQPQPMHPSS